MLSLCYLAAAPGRINIVSNSSKQNKTKKQTESEVEPEWLNCIIGTLIINANWFIDREANSLMAAGHKIITKWTLPLQWMWVVENSRAIKAMKSLFDLLCLLHFSPQLHVCVQNRAVEEVCPLWCHQVFSLKIQAVKQKEKKTRSFIKSFVYLLLFCEVKTVMQGAQLERRKKNEHLQICWMWDLNSCCSSRIVQWRSR